MTLSDTHICIISSHRVLEDPVSIITPLIILLYMAKENYLQWAWSHHVSPLKRTDFWTLWEKARVGCSERIALKQVYYQGWNRPPAQVGCMRQVLGPGALGRPRGMGWRGRWEWGSGWGTHVNPWLIHVNVWQKPLQYCKVISLQLIKINGKKKTRFLWLISEGKSPIYEKLISIFSTYV